MGIPGPAAAKPGILRNAEKSWSHLDLLNMKPQGLPSLVASRTVLAVPIALGAGTTYAPAKQITISGSMCRMLLSFSTRQVQTREAAT